MQDEFREIWNHAKQQEERGHRLFLEKRFQEAAESHVNASRLFLDALSFVKKEEGEVRIRTYGNHHIELANHYHSLAADAFYEGEKESALIHFQSAVEEQKKALDAYEKLESNNEEKEVIKHLKATLHLLMTYEHITRAQIAFLGEVYSEAVKIFKLAEIFSNLEGEFVADLGDLVQLNRSRARSAYIRGQIFRSEALLAMQKEERALAKEKYLKAAQSFEEAAVLNPNWKEYKVLAGKSEKMARAIKV